VTYLKQWRRKEGAKGACAPGDNVQRGGIWGAKIWNYEIWPLLANWRLHCRTNSAGICITELHPQLGVLFVTVHTNAIVVTIRISIADLIGEGGNTARLPRAANTLAPLLLTDTATVAR